MSFRDVCLNALHRLYREDEWLRSLFEVAGIQLSAVEHTLDDVYAAEFFDTLPAAACARYERELGIVTALDMPLDDRRAQILSRWIADGKLTLGHLQAVANSWRYGSIDVEFIGGKIVIKFVSPLGMPADLDNLKATLEVVKPAHLALAYVFMWLTWKDCLTRGTWADARDAGVWENTKRLPTH